MMQWLEGLPSDGRHYYIKAPNGGWGDVFHQDDGRWQWQAHAGPDWFVAEMDGNWGWTDTKEDAQQNVENWLREHGEK